VASTHFRPPPEPSGHERLSRPTLGLRRLLKIKNQELRHMRSLAEGILSQRTEVEQYFLDALNEVKEHIRREKSRSNVESQKTLNQIRAKANSRAQIKSGQTFPAIGPSGLKHMESRAPSMLRGQGREKVSPLTVTWICPLNSAPNS